MKKARFKDAYDCECTLQESSSVVPHVWLGIDNADPKIMAKEIIEGGIGWAKYPVPDSVQFTTRMHLNLEQVKWLIEQLQEFVDENEKPNEPQKSERRTVRNIADLRVGDPAVVCDSFIKRFHKIKISKIMDGCFVISSSGVPWYPEEIDWQATEALINGDK